MAQVQNKTLRRRIAGAYLSSVISISLVLLLVGVAAMLLVNTSRVSTYFKENLQVSVLFKQSASDQQILSYKTTVDKYPFIKKTRIISREEGAEDMKEMLGQDFLAVFQTSPVPVSMSVSLKAAYVSPDSLKKVTSKLAASPIVDEVDCQQSLVESLNENMARITFILGVFIALLLFISIILISNTVRLSVHSQRFNIYTMQLVGATRSFIRAPFIRRAVAQGLVASVISSIILIVALYLVRSSFPQFFVIFTEDLLLSVLGIVVLSGVLICVMSTSWVVGKLLSLSKEELYEQ